MFEQKFTKDMAMKRVNKLYEEAKGTAAQLEKKTQEWGSESYAQAKDRAADFYAKAWEYYEGEDGELEALEKENLERMKMIANRFRIRSEDVV